LTTSAPVPGSSTARELAVADGSARKYRIRSWSSWGIRRLVPGTITEATKIRTNPDNRFRPATSNRGSRGSETNHGIHRHTQKREFGSTLPSVYFRVFRGYPLVTIFLAGVIVQSVGPWSVGREGRGQSSVKPKRGAGGDRKAPKQSQFARLLVVGRSQFRTNPGGIGQAKQTQFPAGGNVTQASVRRAGSVAFPRALGMV